MIKCDEAEIPGLLILLDLEIHLTPLNGLICKSSQVLGLESQLYSGLKFCVKTLKTMCKIMGICLNILR